MEEKLTALVLKAADYNEADKMLSLYCAEFGKLTAVIRGVKKAGAKLKFAAEPFCFGEFLLCEKGGYRIVINCNEIESFFVLRTDYDLYKKASLVLDLLNTYGQENDDNAQLFLCSLKTLQAMQLDQAKAGQIAIKYLLEACKCLGITVELGKCAICGNAYATHYKFDERVGGIVCPACFGLNTIDCDMAALSCLRLISNTELNRQNTLKFSLTIQENALRLIGTYCQQKFGKLKTLSDI